MIHVACVSCQNPYDLDERRLPASGLRMKCPKCATSLLVFPDGRVEAAPPPARPRSATMAYGASPSSAPKGAFGPTQPTSTDAADLPAPRAKAAPPGSPPEAPAIALDDLPAPRAKAPPAPPVQTEAPAIALDDLPAPRAKAPPAPPVQTEAPAIALDDLPAPRAKAPPASPVQPAAAELALDDLPAPRAKAPLAPPVQPAAAGIALDDLPAPRAKAPPVQPAASAITLDDLPAPRAKAPPVQPAASAITLDDLPAPRAKAPAPPIPPALEDLPAPRSRGRAIDDLPAPRRPAAARGATEELDLGGLDLNAAGGRTLDLPAVARGADVAHSKALEAPLSVDLPAPKGFGELDLPAPKGFGELDLPAPKASVDLPAPKGFGELDLPAPKGFGDLDLPAPKASVDLPAPKGFDLDLPAPKASVDLPAPKGFGELDLPAPKGFGDLDLPAPKGFGELDLPSPRAGGVDLPMPKAELPQPRHAADDLDLELPPPRRAAPSQTGTEFSLGGEPGHGEVDLGSGGSEDAMEFADIPVERGTQSAPLPVTTADAARQPAARATRGAPKGLIAGLVGIAALTATGVGLRWTPAGPFGVYAIETYLPGAGDPNEVQTALAAAHAAIDSDTVEAARHAVEQLAALRQRAALNRDLLRGSLFIESMYASRFGDDLNCSSRTAVIASRLEERGATDALSSAADQLRLGNPGRAATLAQSAGSSPDASLLQAEAAFAQDDLDAAAEAFARVQPPTGRSLWGLARVELRKVEAGRGDAAALERAIEATLSASPRHVEARVARARGLIQAGRFDDAATSLREVVGELAVGESHLWTTNTQRSTAHLLLGRVHENRGRFAQALTAYSRATQLGETSPDAVLGAGRMYVALDQATEALTRFEAILGREDADEVMAWTGRPARIEAGLGAARARMLSGEHQEARALLTALAEARPDDAEIRLWQGRSELALEHFDAAEAAFREAIRTAPTEFSGYGALAQLCIVRQRTADAQAVLDDARAHVPDSASLHRQLGQLERDRSNLTVAIDEFRRALALDANDPRTRFDLGAALRRSGRIPEAIHEFDALALVEPSYPGLALERGEIFEALGQPERAVEFYLRANEERPDDPDLTLRLAAAQVASGLLEDAEASLDRAEALQAQAPELLHYRGRIAFARRNFAEAQQHFDRALSLDGTAAEFHLYAGWTALEQGDLGRALERVQTALRRDPSLADGYWIRGTVQLRAGAARDAIADFQQALTLRPTLYAAEAGMGESYDQLRELPSAIAAYRRAVAGDPNRGSWWFRLGQLLLDASQTSASVEALATATRVGDATPDANPWLADAHRVHGDASRLSGNRSAAVEHYRRYLDLAPNGAPDRDAVRRAVEELTR